MNAPCGNLGVRSGRRVVSRAAASAANLLAEYAAFELRLARSIRHGAAYTAGRTGCIHRASGPTWCPPPDGRFDRSRPACRFCHWRSLKPKFSGARAHRPAPAATIRTDRRRNASGRPGRNSAARSARWRAARRAARRRRSALLASAGHTGTNGCRASSRQSRTRAAAARDRCLCALLNARNSAVITTQTVWLPTSSRLVSQQPLRKKPVIGLTEQVSSCPPRTLSDGRAPDGRRFHRTAWSRSLAVA